MQAVFRPNGSQEVVVSNQVYGVMLEVYEGQEYTSETPEGTKTEGERKQVLLMSLSKADARSIASAIMGCAAKQD